MLVSTRRQLRKTLSPSNQQSWTVNPRNTMTPYGERLLEQQKGHSWGFGSPIIIVRQALRVWTTRLAPYLCEISLN